MAALDATFIDWPTSAFEDIRGFAFDAALGDWLLLATEGVREQKSDADFACGIEATQTRFVMRAFHIVVPIGHLYWFVDGAPDIGATQAPYPAGELTDIVVVREFVPM
jgi:hypothetical protein